MNNHQETPEQTGKDAQIARNLTDLALRCEDEEPSRELDADIWRALGYEAYLDTRRYGDIIQKGDKSTIRPLPLVTSSVDAAKLLMPEGWRVQEVSECSSAAGIPGWLVFVRSEEVDCVGGWAETEAPARCAAALNARAGWEAYMAAEERRRYPELTPPRTPRPRSRR